MADELGEVKYLEEGFEHIDEVKHIDEVIETVDDIPPWKGATDYSDIDVSKFKMNEGKNFTQAHKKAVYEANLKHNDGLLRSDMDGTILEEAVKSKKGVTPPSNEAQVDHIIAKSKGGINNPSENAQVLSRKQNRIKSNN